MAFREPVFPCDQKMRPEPEFGRIAIPAPHKPRSAAALEVDAVPSIRLTPMPAYHSISWFPIIAPIGFFFFLGALFWFHTYTGLGRDKTVLVLVASITIGAFYSYHRAWAMEPFIRQSSNLSGDNDAEIFLGIAAAGLVFPFTVAFALRLWSRWI